MSTLDIDDEIAHEICTRFEYSGQHFVEGSFVAIEGGRVLGVSGTFEEADAIRKLVLCRVAAGDGEGVGADVDGGHVRSLMLRR